MLHSGDWVFNPNGWTYWDVGALIAAGGFVIVLLIIIALAIREL